MLNLLLSGRSRVRQPQDSLFERGLACAALSPGLRSLLVFDSQSSDLEWIATTLQQMVEIVTGREVVRRRLSTNETDDELWGGIALSGEPAGGGFNLTWQAGLLSEGRDEATPQLILIPDLTRLSLAAARAAVMLMGADVAHLERHGQHQQWRPNLYWLAGCASDEVGKVSPHLLDRFMVRLNGRDIRQPDRVTEIMTRLESEQTFTEPSLPALSPGLADQLRQASQVWPEINPEAIDRVFDYLQASQGHSLRRDLSLLHLAWADARLRGHAEVRAVHVRRAADIIQLRPVAESRPETPTEPVLPDLPPEPPNPERPNPEPPAPAAPRQAAQVEKPVYEPDTTETLESAALPFSPYLEDEALVERDVDVLRLPPLRYKSGRLARGPIIGTQTATQLHDLALVDTLLEAIKFQPIRHQHQVDGTRLLLSPADLRSYRRATVPEQMLLILLDYTACKDRDWQAALLPHLRWAYTVRANVCLIQVGSARARHDLRAERLLASTILSPPLASALAAGPGQATPLAHGLDMALQTLRHALQHGRNALQRARLVVITDGRGNVPLAASRSGEITPPIRREGIDDALEVAGAIRRLKHVYTYLLNPQPDIYADLPLDLAEMLAAQITPISPLEVMDE